MNPQHRALLQGLTDTHCHLHQYAEADAVRSDCRDAGMQVHVVTSNPREYEAACEWLENDPHCQASLGLIPQDAHQLEREADRFFTLLPESPLIGEVGLDYVTHDETEREKQRQFFRRVLEASAGKWVSIHSRRASGDVLDLVAEHNAGTAVLHWFSGQVEEVKRACAMPRLYFSINTAMITSRRSKALIRNMDRTRVLLESDGPYVQIDGTPARPLDLWRVVEGLARIWEMEAEAVSRQLQRNAAEAR